MTPLKVLFLCTGNSARSILAEAYLNHAGKGAFVAHSAGSRPAGQVNPLALELLQMKGIATAALRSKSWDEFATQALDLIITVCDSAARETCPVWSGHPVGVHWGVADPAAVTGAAEERRKAFGNAFDELRRRIDGLIALPVHRLDRTTLKGKLEQIA